MEKYTDALFFGKTILKYHILNFYSSFLLQDTCTKISFISGYFPTTRTTESLMKFHKLCLLYIIPFIVAKVILNYNFDEEKITYKNVTSNTLLLTMLFLECYFCNFKILMYSFICLSWKHCSYIIVRRNTVLCVWLRCKYSGRRKKCNGRNNHKSYKQSLIFFKKSRFQ